MPMYNVSFSGKKTKDENYLSCFSMLYYVDNSITYMLLFEGITGNKFKLQMPKKTNYHVCVFHMYVATY